MREADTIIFYLIAICWVEVNASDVLYSAFFVTLFVCLRIPFVCLLNDFTEVYSYLWMAVYIQTDMDIYNMYSTIKRMSYQVEKNTEIFRTQKSPPKT